MGLLLHDGNLGADLVGVVSPDLRTEAVLERRNQAAAVGVVLGVGGRHYEDVQLEPDQVATNLDVTFLEHVQQTHLDSLREVGQLVDGEDAAIRLRHEAERQRTGVVEVEATSHLDRVNFTNEVGHRGVGRGQLLGETLAAVDPRNGGVVTQFGDKFLREHGERRERIVTNLRASDNGHPLVQEFG